MLCPKGCTAVNARSPAYVHTDLQQGLVAGTIEHRALSDENTAISTVFKVFSRGLSNGTLITVSQEDRVAVITYWLDRVEQVTLEARGKFFRSL